MQKKFWLLLIPIGLIIIAKVLTPPKERMTKIFTSTQVSQMPPIHSLKKSIFIPYWSGSFSKNETMYDSYYYFGIVPKKDGYLEDEVGLQNMSLVATIPEKQKKLVLRMLDNTVNDTLLSNKIAQTTLVTEVRKILSKNSYSGLILDLEVPFTLQANKKEQITNFVQLICTSIKTDYKTCSMLIYGDFSYRNRPFDLKKLGEVMDTILLMAYDFHKAGGEPGPNFPFEEKQLYGYDFKTMIQDTLKLVPKEKIEVVFGMYGYDWTLNEQGAPLKGATSLSVNAISNKIAHAKFIIKSNNAKEKTVEYTDEEGRKHVIWYEDEESTAIKTKYLLLEGVWQVSFWASSYF